MDPLVRNGKLIFNSAEKTSQYMQELTNQFKMFDMEMPYCADGPDAVEGGVTMIDVKSREKSPILTSSLSQLRAVNRRGW